MATLNISIPEEMKAWIENQTRIGLYSNSSDYIRDLIRKDQEKRGATLKISVNIFDDTKYVLFGNLSPSDEATMAEAESKAIPCISLDLYKSQLPDALEMHN